MSRRTFGQRINDWLAEPKGQVFRQGKWRFWYPALVGLTALNAVMTAVIFGADGMQKYIGSIVVLAGAVLCWLALGLLHYSDSDDRLLAIGTAALDSVTLLFVSVHFAFLLWCQGHLWTLRAAESQYRSDIATYNAQWKPVTESNERIAATVERIASVEKETESLRNDTAYWSRRNKVEPSKSGIKFDAKLSAVEVPPPPKAPTESSAEFLASWDWCIRVAGFGELALSIITLIFVRGRTAWLNARSAARVEEFPDEVDAEDRPSTRAGRLKNSTTHVSSKNERHDGHRKTTQDDTVSSIIPNLEGLDRLRECLKLIAFQHSPLHFKADVKDDCVWIRAMASDHGIQRTKNSAKAKLSILDDAMTMAPNAFRERLEKFLRQSGFEI